VKHGVLSRVSRRFKKVEGGGAAIVAEEMRLTEMRNKPFILGMLVSL
jgi:hypothetical protein